MTTGPWPTITVDPRIAFGEPCIGTPPTRVADLAGMVAAGGTVDTTAGEYGRTLPNEGRVYDPYGYRLSEAAARCSCGEESPVLPNDAQRRKWHANHKQALRDREA